MHKCKCNQLIINHRRDPRCPQTHRSTHTHTHTHSPLRNQRWFHSLCQPDALRRSRYLSLHSPEACLRSLFPSVRARVSFQRPESTPPPLLSLLSLSPWLGLQRELLRLLLNTGAHGWASETAANHGWPAWCQQRSASHCARGSSLAKLSSSLAKQPEESGETWVVYLHTHTHTHTHTPPAPRSAAGLQRRVTRQRRFKCVSSIIAGRFSTFEALVSIRTISTSTIQFISIRTVPCQLNILN